MTLAQVRSETEKRVGGAAGGGVQSMLKIWADLGWLLKKGGPSLRYRVLYFPEIKDSVFSYNLDCF